MDWWVFNRMEFEMTNISLFGYTSTQVALLVMFYGFNINMPSWVLWFPTIILGICLAIVGAIFLFVLLGVILK